MEIATFDWTPHGSLDEPYRYIPNDSSSENGSDTVFYSVVTRPGTSTLRRSMTRTSSEFTQNISVYSLTNCSNVSMGNSSRGVSVTTDALMERLELFERKTSKSIQEIADSNLKDVSYNTQLCLKRHSQQGAFVQTKAFKNAKAKLQGHQLVVISGNPGDGKTALGMELLNYFSQNHDDHETKTPFLVTTPNKLREILCRFQHAIIFIDDLLESSIIQTYKLKWETVFNTITYAAKHLDVMIILCINSHELKEHQEQIQQYDLFSGLYHIDLCSEQFKLLVPEKESILKNHLNRMDRHYEDLNINKIALSDHPFGYPQSCVLFAEHDHCFQQGEEFFKQPLESVCKRLNIYRVHCMNKYKYWVLVSILHCNGLSKNIVFPNKRSNFKKEVLEIKKLAERCKCKYSIIKFTDALLSIQGSFVHYNSQSSKYEFASNSIREAVLLVYGRSNPEEVIKRLNIYTLCNHVGISQCDDRCDYLHVQTQDYRILMNRLIYEIRHGHAIEIAGLDVWRYPNFFRNLFDLLEGRKILQLYRESQARNYRGFLYWILYQQQDNIAFFDDLLQHLVFANTCCWSQSRKFLKQEMYKCLQLACEDDNIDAVKVLKDYNVKIDQNIIQICTERNRYQILDILRPSSYSQIQMDVLY